MAQYLTRAEVDKILGTKTKERIPTRTEIESIEAETIRVAHERHIDPADLTDDDMAEILKNLGLENIKLYTKDEILDSRK